MVLSSSSVYECKTYLSKYENALQNEMLLEQLRETERHCRAEALKFHLNEVF